MAENEPAVRIDLSIRQILLLVNVASRAPMYDHERAEVADIAGRVDASLAEARQRQLLAGLPFEPPPDVPVDDGSGTTAENAPQTPAAGDGHG